MQPSSQPAPGATPSEEGHPIDFAHLDHQTFGDRDLQGELLGLFATQAQGIIAALDASSLDPRGRGLPRAAELLHTLCGSARAVGSWQVADEAEAMERDLRHPAEAPAIGRDRLAALGRSVGQVCAAIDDLSQRRVA